MGTGSETITSPSKVAVNHGFLLLDQSSTTPATKSPLQRQGDTEKIHRGRVQCTEPSHTCFCMGLHLLGPFTMARAVNEAPRSSPNSDAALRGFGVEPRAPSATGLLTMQPRGHDHGPSDPLFGATRCASVHWPRRPAQRPAETEPSRSQTRGARGGETMIDERRGVGVGKEDVGDV